MATTTKPRASSVHEHSVIGIGASIGSETAAGLVRAGVGAPTLVQGTATVGAGGLPGAIAWKPAGPLVEGTCATAAGRTRVTSGDDSYLQVTILTVGLAPGDSYGTQGLIYFLGP